MAIPNKAELIQLFDDYVFVRTNGKWKSVTALFESSFRQAQKLAKNTFSYFYSFLATSSISPSDVKFDADYTDKDTPTIKQEICNEFKAKFNRANTADQWLTLCSELGNEARKQAFDEKNESLLVKTLCAARSMIEHRLKSDVNSDEFKAITARIETLNKKRIPVLQSIRITKNSGHIASDKEKENRDLLTELADLGDDDSIIEATEANLFKNFVLPPKSSAPHLPFDPTTSTAPKINVHKPLTYQNNYHDLFQQEIRLKKEKIEVAHAAEKNAIAVKAAAKPSTALIQSLLPDRKDEKSSMPTAALSFTVPPSPTPATNIDIKPAASPIKSPVAVSVPVQMPVIAFDDHYADSPQHAPSSGAPTAVPTPTPSENTDEPVAHVEVEDNVVDLKPQQSSQPVPIPKKKKNRR